MDDVITSVTWEGYEHAHEEKSGDWYWIVGIVCISVAIVALLLGNPLFSLLVLIAGMVMALATLRGVTLVPYAVTTRGVRVEDKLYPYSALESYFISEEDEDNPLLLVKSQKFFMPLMVIPIPPEYIDEVEELIANRLPEEPMEEPFLHRLMELIGL